MSVIYYLLAIPCSPRPAHARYRQGRPLLVHVPLTTAFQGAPITIMAMVHDESGIEKVMLHLRLTRAGMVTETSHQMVNTFTGEAIKVRVISESAPIYSAPTTMADTLLLVYRDEVLDTYGKQEEYGFYHIGLSAEREGWLLLGDAVIAVVGDSYRHTIEQEHTLDAQIAYSIEVGNVHGQTTKTPYYTIGLIALEDEAVEKDVSQLQSSLKSLEGKAPDKKPFFKSVWFIGGLVAVGCGTAAYYLLAGKKEESGSLSIEVEW